ncbi:hypothetical protein FNF27_07953 [Cafeteria roenbergensis]|uniref:Ca3427-like PBP 2 domain-containing protein n=1 Tax=Cafeteria roenbergensis TaxID=33653 RepID=A0A5A8DDF8_CAFRO|nr:hypothetical protein FNF31_06748 [Cafeteria roenbergensis]KAA0153230.1 hypothetical protein FNF28_06964 [Cafeteria roenbergensis]KAA0163248.1 hypothetical protein FNF27_07953 [Cafeteria roenbergensis]
MAHSDASPRDAASEDAVVFGGVPEHFNLAIWEHLNSGRSEAACGVPTRFVAVPGGTGAMMAALSDGSVDVAIALTEGVVSAAAKEKCASIRVVAPYVMSPLAWGVAAGATDAAPRSLTELAALPEVRVGVSRMGSGSHLMSFLLAEEQGWDASRLRFVVCGDITGLRRAVRGVREDGEPEAHLFMWETGMIEPFVAAGEISQIGVVLTPWPCFVMAARAAWLDEARPTGETNRDRLLRVLAPCRDAVAAFLADPAAALDAIAARFMVSRGAAATWMRAVRYAAGRELPRSALATAAEALRRLGQLSAEEASLAPPERLADSGCVVLTADDPASLAADGGALDEAACASPLRAQAHPRPAEQEVEEPDDADTSAGAVARRREAMAALDAYLRSLGGEGVR